MKQKILNISTTIFLGIFCLVICKIASAKKNYEPQALSRVKSHLQFDKEFSGIAKVIDGDSIIVDDREVRLFGIDAPEYHQTCFNTKNLEYSCGKVAQEFLYDFINGKKVTCRYSEKDKYNRFLAKCFLDKTSINEELIKNGMAVIYNFSESEEKMDNLEIQAQSKKTGIWQGAFQLPKDYRKSHPRKK
ncbi:MAG: thermonuclease family protein [Rickettsiales bacterium]|nr:thermonuclease family protein [Rickettsiales bacterium]